LKRDQVGKSSTPLTSKQSYDIISSAYFGAIALRHFPAPMDKSAVLAYNSKLSRPSA
jgi:hypothetical protein